MHTQSYTDVHKHKHILWHTQKQRAKEEGARAALIKKSEQVLKTIEAKSTTAQAKKEAIQAKAASKAAAKAAAKMVAKAVAKPAEKSGPEMKSPVVGNKKGKGE